MTPFFIWTTTTLDRLPTDTKIAAIQRRIREIVDDAEVVCFREPGTRKVKLWLERPNDGSNSSNAQRTANRLAAEMLAAWAAEA